MEAILLICLQMDSDDSIPVMDLANQEYQVSPDPACISHCIRNDIVLFAFQHAVECVSKPHMSTCMYVLLVNQLFLDSTDYSDFLRLPPIQSVSLQ